MKRHIGVLIGSLAGACLWLVMLAADLLTLRIIGAVLVVLAIATLALYVWSRFASDAVLRQLAEAARSPRPSVLMPWETPKVQRGPYDWNATGDFR